MHYTSYRRDQDFNTTVVVALNPNPAAVAGRFLKSHAAPTRRFSRSAPHARPLSFRFPPADRRGRRRRDACREAAPVPREARRVLRPAETAAVARAKQADGRRQAGVRGTIRSGGAHRLFLRAAASAVGRKAVSRAPQAPCSAGSTSASGSRNLFGWSSPAASRTG